MKAREWLERRRVKTCFNGACDTDSESGNRRQPLQQQCYQHRTIDLKELSWADGTLEDAASSLEATTIKPRCTIRSYLRPTHAV